MRIQMIAHDVTENATTARISEVAPFVVQSGTYIVTQEGENTTSTVVIKTRTFAVVHVGLAHEYGGAQQWYYFERKPNAPIRRLTASQLSTRRRQQVLEAYRAGKAPSWAKQPFVEKPVKPSKAEKPIRYKAVAVRKDGTFCSIYDGMAYVIGKTLRQKVQADPNGDYYVYRSAEKAETADVPYDSDYRDLPRAILKCEVWGRCEWYGETAWDDQLLKIVPTENTKEAWTYLKPIAVVE